VSFSVVLKGLFTALSFALATALPPARTSAPEAVPRKLRRLK
jgi:hypothetical protein